MNGTAVNVPQVCAANTPDAQANSSAGQPCAGDAIEELSALRPFRRAIPNALIAMGNFCTDTVRVANETINGTGATNAHANFGHAIGLSDAGKEKSRKRLQRKRKWNPAKKRDNQYPCKRIKLDAADSNRGNLNDQNRATQSDDIAKLSEKFDILSI